MSIEHMSKVWKFSKHDGAHLLLMLALADFAAEDGSSYPSISTLAKKVRSSERYVQRLLKECVASGELTVKWKASKYKTNVFTIKLHGEQEFTIQPVHGELGLTTDGEPEFTTMVRRGSPSMVNRSSPDPSLRSSSRSVSKNPSSSSSVLPSKPKRGKRAAARMEEEAGRSSWDLKTILGSKVKKDLLAKIDKPGGMELFVGWYLQSLTQPRLNNPIMYCVRQVERGAWPGNPFASVACEDREQLLTALWDPEAYIPGTEELLDSDTMSWAKQFRDLLPAKDREALLKRAIVELHLNGHGELPSQSLPLPEMSEEEVDRKFEKTRQEAIRMQRESEAEETERWEKFWDLKEAQAATEAHRAEIKRERAESKKQRSRRH